MGLLVVLALVGCQRASEAVDAYAARAAVTRYDQGLVEAYRSGKTDGLAPVATEAEISRAEAVIAGLADRGLFMLARPVDLEVDATRVLMPELLEVDTVEGWTYEHRARKEPDRPVEVKHVTYRMTYQVRRRGDAWVVQSVVER